MLGLLLAPLGSRALAQTAAASAGTVHMLMRQPLSSQPGTDVIMLTVDYPPSGTTPPHEHPGYTYAYVLQGSVVSQLDHQPAQTYITGQMWSELPHQAHMVSRNASKTEPAKLLVYMIIPHGDALTKFLPAQ